jgi:putative flippase GtrA
MLSNSDPVLSRAATSVNYKRILKFLVVGALNTAVGYGLFALFIFLGWHFAIATLLSTILAVTFNFFSTGRLVFNGSANKNLGRFIGSYLILYIINISFLKGLLSLQLSEYMAGILLLPIMAILSYILQSRFVFTQ